jgi:molecular chaperone IbpA
MPLPKGKAKPKLANIGVIAMDTRIPYFNPASWQKDLDMHLGKITSSAIGFEPLLEKFQSMVADNSKTIGYPPYNIRKVDDNKYIIEIAVAGFIELATSLSSRVQQRSLRRRMRTSFSEVLLPGILPEHSISQTALRFRLPNFITVC